MRSRVQLCLGAAVAAAALTVTSVAFAATVDLQFSSFDRSALSAARAARATALADYTIRGFENFQSYQPWNGSSGNTNPQNTNVGSFTSFGPAGSGHSVVGGADKLQVRNDSTMPWGRYTTSPAVGGNWLDSNDNLGMRWEIGGIGTFDSLAFFVLDAADVGGKFSIKVGDTLFE